MLPKIKNSRKRTATESQSISAELTSRRQRLVKAEQDVTEPSTSNKSMSVSKALQFMDKKDLECAICLNRFHQPKALKCMHTYCLQCIQKVKSNGKVKCPTCGQEHDITKGDLKQQLASNTMVSQLLEYVTKIEDQKPTKCSFCDNQPAYHCSTCQLYLCESQCVKQHKMIPLTKDHPLYTLDSKPDGSSDNQNICPVHCNTPLEFYCSTCNKSACKQCEVANHCYQKQHKVIPMANAVTDFNKDANEAVKIACTIKNVLKQKLEFIAKDRTVFDSQLNLCRTAIEILEIKITKRVQEKSRELISTLENIYKEKQKNINSKIEDIDAEMNHINNVMASLNSMMNKPEEREFLESYKTIIDAVRDRILGTDFDKLFHIRNFRPNLIPSTHLNELMNTEGIGKITTVDSMIYKVVKSNVKISAKIEQTFVVDVYKETKEDAGHLVATLIHSSGKELATKVEYGGYRNYKITGRCNVTGDWQMHITVSSAHIKGSPVIIKVTPAPFNEYDYLFKK